MKIFTSQLILLNESQNTSSWFLMNGLGAKNAAPSFPLPKWLLITNQAHTEKSRTELKHIPVITVLVTICWIIPMFRNYSGNLKPECLCCMFYSVIFPFLRVSSPFDSLDWGLTLVRAIASYSKKTRWSPFVWYSNGIRKPAHLASNLFSTIWILNEFGIQISTV